LESIKYISRVISIGHLPLGGQYPVRIQSMTNTDTMDTVSTLGQCISLIESGCEMIRVTAPGTREAKQLGLLKDELIKKGFVVPLIADIHFNPNAAEVAAGIVEKVRINPGNYVDRKKGASIDYSDRAYREELEKIAERLYPLISICKKNNTAIRIGVNHGSLSERIMNRFGNTPTGMVESAIEFANICRTLDFDNLVLSMKSSDVKQMIYANRLLAQRMISEGMDYPLHLGVTEAGDGEDGRIKSAAGIGALLADGIGDTIRVSLTEDPVAEIPVARRIAEQFAGTRKQPASGHKINIHTLPVAYERRSTDVVENIGGKQIPAVSNELPENFLKSEKVNVISFNTKDPAGQIVDLIQAAVDKKDKRPVVLKITDLTDNVDNILVNCSSLMAKLMADGCGDGIVIDAPLSDIQLNQIELDILQALHLRISKTEYIACPSCGRTLFNIQEALERIRQKTSHLKGLKIGVMGCIVNGPGEMADADYGYVGSGQGKVTLYKGKEVVKKDIEEGKAVESLISVIRENGDWIDL